MSKSCNALATPRLFHTIALYQHSVAWESLNSIANSSNLAPLVEKINIAHVGYLEQIYDFERYKSLIASDFEDRRDFTDHPPAGGPLAKWDYSVQATWERYKQWRDAELVMRNHDKALTAPYVAPERFDNLKSIETATMSSLATIERKPELLGQLPRIWPLSTEILRYFATRMRDVSGSRDDEKQPSTHLQTIMIALQCCGKHLDKLILHRMEDLEVVTDPAIGPPGLKHLVIDITYIRDQYPNDYRISPWLLYLDNLGTLELRQKPDSDHNADIPCLLQAAKWPNLRRLDLRRFQSSQFFLRRFIRKHLRKLDYLHVSEPIMHRYDWAIVRQEAEGWYIRGKRVQVDEKPYREPRVTSTYS